MKNNADRKGNTTMLNYPDYVYGHRIYHRNLGHTNLSSTESFLDKYKDFQSPEIKL